MLAYVFWHQPQPGFEPSEYEARLTAFHERLAATPPPGFLGSRSVATGGTPWLGDPCYEDWYLVADYAALGALNVGAIDTDHASTHDVVASQASSGTGGLYELVAGCPTARAASHVWFAKPPGWSYVRLHADIALTYTGASDCALWQRQLVLGPSPEYCAAGGLTPVGITPVVSSSVREVVASFG